MATGGSRARERRTKARLYAFVASLKDGPCVDCGEQYEPCCMEFDHTDEKNHSIAKMVEMKASRARILEEVRLTELVCVLCHRSRTFFRRVAVRVSAKKLLMSSVLVLRAKARPCNLCGARRPWYQMDFDHLDPSTKLFSLASAKNYTVEQVRAEASKCQLLCALCHRRKTFQGVYNQLLVSDEGIYRPNIKITPETVGRVLQLKLDGVAQKDIAATLGLSGGTVSNIVHGKYRNTKLAALSELSSA